MQLVETVQDQQSNVTERAVVRGKFLYVGKEKFWVKGISYGTFEIGEEGRERLVPEIVERDFSQMAANGLNVVRVHTGPPRWLLDLAQKKGLRVMVGLNWGEQMAFLDDPERVKQIEGRVKGWIRECAGHPAVLCYSVGNEITASIVRWHGRKRVEKFIEHLYRVAKQEDPETLVTYVNYPSTEYLQLPFLDLLCFNVYLENQRDFEDYLARLQNLSDDRPILLSEIGLDSLRNGEERQANTLDWQVRSAFKLGCCGVVVFAWTDDWYHGKYPVEDWKFGLTTRERSPKKALRMVGLAFEESPFPPAMEWPMISVVICSYNGSSTIRDTLDGLSDLDYPNFEVILVNDGSTDSTPQIGSEYPVRLINTKNQGLGQARNTGIEAATGDLVAFIDDDAYPDKDWLKFLALFMADARYVGAGGPNIPPPNDGMTADAVANSPGNPSVVLLTDKIAEHIPGCNMIFRKNALTEIGRFDPVFRAAGDDVDLCWRLREEGGTIGFCPAATVWHHRRNSVRKYWRQQVGYGKAEALLERKWPSKYDSLGQSAWLGRIYGRGVSKDLASFRGRVYQGVWGSAPFQSLYQPAASRWALALSPEWYLITGAAALGYALSLGWGPSTIFGALLLLAIALPTGQALMNARRARLPGSNAQNGRQLLKLRTAVFFLHLVQPLARLNGRLKGGLTPWRSHGTLTLWQLRASTLTMWREERQGLDVTLEAYESELKNTGMRVKRGGEFDSWDLEARRGTFGGSRLQAAVEEHAPGKQFLHFRITPRYSRPALFLTGICTIMSVIATSFGALAPSILWGAAACLLGFRIVTDAAFATGTLRGILKRSGAE